MDYGLLVIGIPVLLVSYLVSLKGVVPLCNG